MENELRAFLGPDFELEIKVFDPGPSSVDMGLFDLLSSVIRESDPRGIPIPYVLGGVTDARFFSKLGIQTYGFTPLKLPDDFSFVSTIHAADERVPVAALEFGVKAIFSALQKFH
jgi:acetylornithine deacetylase/succinyl-diaminopimelate desuccinylase-like protein